MCTKQHLKCMQQVESFPSTHGRGWEAQSLHDKTFTIQFRYPDTLWKNEKRESEREKQRERKGTCKMQSDIHITTLKLWQNKPMVNTCCSARMLTHNSTGQLYQYTHIHIYLHNGIKYGKPNSLVIKNRMYGSSKRNKQLHKLTIWFSSN